MTRRDFVKAAAFYGSSFVLGSISLANRLTANNRSKKPLNFVFILIDDLGWKDVGCFGSTFYETPNVDRLAGEGMRFTNAYAASPVCSPTRASILTGKYPARLQITHAIGCDDAGTSYKRFLALGEFTLAEAFKEAGYATGFVGKWHLGGMLYRPENQGFDFHIGDRWKKKAPHYLAPYEEDLNLTHNVDGEYLTDRLSQEAVRFIEDNHKGPFLLYLAHYAVHTPLEGKDRYVKKYEEKAKSMGLGWNQGSLFRPEEIGKTETRQYQNHTTYAAMVQSMDESVGRVLSKLEELGIDDNTVVIFTSDNGGLSCIDPKPTSILPLRAGKCYVYEGGIRVPLIIKWPAVTEAGSTCHEPVISMDFYPTMLEIAQLPLRPEQHVDGVSLAGLLKGKETLTDRALSWHYPHYYWVAGGAIRYGDYKLVEHFYTGKMELYDLKSDIGETNDLSAALPDKAGELRQMMQKWREQVNAKMPHADYKPKYAQYNL